jgi:hypothetical protein
MARQHPPHPTPHQLANPPQASPRPRPQPVHLARRHTLRTPSHRRRPHRPTRRPRPHQPPLPLRLAPRPQDSSRGQRRAAPTHNSTTNRETPRFDLTLADAELEHGGPSASCNAIAQTAHPPPARAEVHPRPSTSRHTPRVDTSSTHTSSNLEANNFEPNQTKRTKQFCESFFDENVFCFAKTNNENLKRSNELRPTNEREQAAG